MVYVQFKGDTVVGVHRDLPYQVYLDNGLTRTALYELPPEKLESIGLIAFTEVTPNFDETIQQWNGEHDLDKAKKTATQKIIDIPIETLKAMALSMAEEKYKQAQAEGCLCSNGIRLKIEEHDLIKFTQLMVGIMAFQPATVNVRDYDGKVHTVTKEVASQMMLELFVYGQTLLNQAWVMENDIKTAKTASEIPKK